MSFKPLGRRYTRLFPAKRVPGTRFRHGASYALIPSKSAQAPGGSFPTYRVAAAQGYFYGSVTVTGSIKARLKLPRGVGRPSRPRLGRKTRSYPPVGTRHDP